MTAELLRAHIRSLEREHGIVMDWITEDRRRRKEPYGFASSFLYPPMVQATPVVDEDSYWVVLHEIGHCVLNHPRKRHIPRDAGLLFIEAQAWCWAFQNSIIEPDENRRLLAWKDNGGGGLGSYEEILKYPPKNHWARAFYERMKDYMLGEFDVLPGMVTANWPKPLPGIW